MTIFLEGQRELAVSYTTTHNDDTYLLPAAKPNHCTLRITNAPSPYDGSYAPPLVRCLIVFHWRIGLAVPPLWDLAIQVLRYTHLKCLVIALRGFDASIANLKNLIAEIHQHAPGWVSLKFHCLPQYHPNTTIAASISRT